MILLATVLCSQLVITDGDTFECNEGESEVLGLIRPRPTSLSATQSTVRPRGEASTSRN